MIGVIQLPMLQVFVILAVTIILFVIDIVRVDIVAIIVLILLGLSGILNPDQLFSGFSSEAVVSLISVMVISAGLERSGCTARLANWILEFSSEKVFRINLLIMIIPGLLSSFMRSFGTTALFLPVINRISMRTHLSRSKLLMPMAFCAILGGALTMIGASPLMLLNGLLANLYQYGNIQQSIDSNHLFSLFEVLPIGLMLFLSGVIYLLIIQRWLPNIKNPRTSAGTPKMQFLKTYGKGGDIFEVEVLPNSGFVGLNLQAIELQLESYLSIIAIKKDKHILFPPLRKTEIQAGDRLAIMGNSEPIEKLCLEQKLKLFPKLDQFSETLHSSRAGLCEAVVPPSSSLIGAPVRELHMRRNYQMHVVALYRGSRVYQGDELKKLSLRSGDTLGMYSEWSALSQFNENPDFAVVTTQYPKNQEQPEKIPQALFFSILPVLLILVGHFPISVSLLIGAAGMVAARVLKIDEAYELVSWKTVFLIAGLIPLGLAMQVSGAVDWIAQQFSLLPGSSSILTVKVLLAIISTISALFISNIGATALLVPVAAHLAINLNVDPKPFVLIVALASLNTFLFPTHQVNALILGAGQYTVRDFIKFGGGMTIVFWVVLLLGIQVIY